MSSSDRAFCVRRATVQDAEPVAGLLNKIIADRDGTALTRPVTVSEEAGDIAALLEAGGCLLLAERDGLLLGFQGVERQGPASGEIGTFVAREARGQGTGRRLLGKTCRWAGGQGLTRLTAEVAAHNLRGQQAYRAWGFVDTAPEQTGSAGTSGRVQLVLTL